MNVIPRSEKTFFFAVKRREEDTAFGMQRGKGFAISMMETTPLPLSLAPSNIAAIDTITGAMAGALIYTAPVGLLYFLGAMGVRERSRFASLAVFFCYALECFSWMLVSKSGPGVMQILFLALLLANIRAVWLADAWRSQDLSNDSPFRMEETRLEETLMDRIANRMPAALWPVGRFVFYAGTCVYGLLELLAIAGALFIPRASIR